MSKNYGLEDSESEDDTKRPALDFLSSEEKAAIARCNIQLNNGGRYSEDAMSRAIAAVGQPPLEALSSDQAGSESYQKYCIKKSDFFGRALYSVHGKNESTTNPISEETILFEIEAILRSEKKIKNTFLKRKVGMLVFGPWFNYALQRLVELSSVSSESLEEYTAVKIIRSLFSFITTGLPAIRLLAHLQKLKREFGIDWEENVRNARRVIDHCGGSTHILDSDLSVAEAHVETIKNSRKPGDSSSAPPSDAASATASAATSATSAPPPVASTTTNQDQDKINEEAKQRIAKLQADRAATGTEKRLAARKAKEKAEKEARRAAAASANPAASSSPAAAASMSSGTPGGTVSRSDSSGQTNVGYEQPPPDAGYGRKAPPEQSTTSSASYTRNPPPPQQSATSYGGQGNERSSSSTAAAASAQGMPSFGGSDGGWGRPRGASVVKTKGSWAFARRTLSCNIPVDENPQPAQDSRSSYNDSNRQEARARGGPPTGRPPAARESYEHRDDNRGGRDYQRSGSGQYQSRNSDYQRSGSGRDNGFNSSEGRDRDYEHRGGRYDDNRSSTRPDDRGRDYHRSGSRGERNDYPRGGGGYSDRDSRSDDYRNPRNRDETSRGGYSVERGGYTQGTKRGHSQVDGNDQDHRQKRWRGPNEGNAPSAVPAPVAAAPVPAPPAGRGRGAHVNKPAWMNNEQYSSQGGPTGVQSNNIAQANPAPSTTAPVIDPVALAQAVSLAQSKAKSFAQPPAGAERGVGRGTGRGRGRGRGAHVNRPAWMTAENGPSGMPNSSSSSGGVTANPAVQTPSAGRGRGAHMNRPAWMTQQENGMPAVTAPPQQQQPPAAQNVMQHALGNGQGRGRGRGKDANLPAWMTHPKN